MKNHSKTKTAACCLFRSRTLRAPAIALAGGIAAFLGLDHQASAQAIDTIPSWNGTSSIGSFGQVNTATYGQTFTLTQTGYLSSVEFLIKDNSANPIAYQPFIYAFSGNKIVGNALFTGAAGCFSARKFPASQHCTNSSVTDFNFSQRARMDWASFSVIWLPSAERAITASKSANSCTTVFIAGTRKAGCG